MLISERSELIETDESSQGDDEPTVQYNLRSRKRKGLRCIKAWVHVERARPTIIAFIATLSSDYHALRAPCVARACLQQEPTCGSPWSCSWSCPRIDSLRYARVHRERTKGPCPCKQLDLPLDPAAYPAMKHVSVPGGSLV